MENHLFRIQENEDQTLSGIWNIRDEFEMNWVSEGKHWGETLAPKGIQTEIFRKFEEDGSLVESYLFSNETDTDIFLLKDELGIQVPLPDNYKSAEICMKERCHVHLWCGGENSCIRAERMSGIAPHLGIVLTEGTVNGYSVDRDLKAISNDRGTFILHPAITHLLPGEKKKISWRLFWFQNRREFEDRVSAVPGKISVKLKRAVFFADEITELEAVYQEFVNEAGKTGETGVTTEPEVGISEEAKQELEIEITANGEPVPYTCKAEGQRFRIQVRARMHAPGEIIWKIRINGHIAWARTLVLPEIGRLVENRCRFLVEKQQYHNENSALDGAFLIYDNEEKQLYYSEEYDHNGGRERIAMGVVLAVYLQNNQNQKAKKALDDYTNYICRELYDEQTGIVYNDIYRNNTWHRLYNYPWMAVFFMERFRLTKDLSDLEHMYRIIKTYYEQGGEKFYAIGIPMCESIALLKENGREREAEELLGCYEEHGQLIAAKGLNYPAHEVNYEQSIVAPAVMYLFQLYILTGKTEYLNAGKMQADVLRLFNGMQPDYRLYQVAIRHWDGFWFGKRKTYGDTFPHYWSALSGMAFYYEGLAEKKEEGKEDAENSLRGVLSMIHPDGSATCAYVYPDQVNGRRAAYEDPWANDQDWGLYFYMKAGQRYHEK